ncbi:hypothetical protein LCGC14_2911700, partial [marine sediment metagenome]
TGSITVNVGALSYIWTTDVADGTPIGITILTTDDTLTMYTSGYDADGNYIGLESVTWGRTGTLDPIAAGPTTSVTFDPSTANPTTTGTITASHATVTGAATGQITVGIGALDHIVIEDAPGGVGNIVTTYTMPTNDTFTLYAIGYDADNNYTSDVSVAWATTGTLDATPAGPAASTVFTPTLAPTSGTITADDGALPLPHTDTTGAVTVNSINLIFSGTGGPKRGLYAVGELAGASHANWGMWKFRTYINAVMDETVFTLCANLHIKEAGRLIDSQQTPNSGEYASAPLYVTVETDGSDTPDMSGGSIAAIYVGYYNVESGGAPVNAYVMHFNNHASYDWDGLLRLNVGGELGDSAHSGTGAHVIGFDSDVIVQKIPIKIGPD